MRLIDAEKCPCKNCGISYCYENCNKYYEWLNGCAYDVEKVVVELTKQAFCRFENCENCHTCEPVIDEKKAKEIVRKGGVE